MAGLDHRYSRRRLGPFVDNELQPADVDRIIAHLWDCEDCGAEVQFLLRVRAALESCQDASPDPDGEAGQSGEGERV